MGSAPRQGNRQTALIFNCFFGKTIKKFRQITTYPTVPRLTQFKSWTKKL